MRGSLDSIVLIPFASDAFLWVYSILSFAFIEKMVGKKFNPKYTHMNLSKEAYDYRVGRERILITSWLFCSVNFFSGALASLIIYGTFSGLAIVGLVGLLFASLFIMFGCVLMVVRNVRTGERNSILMLFGFFFLIPPAVYILFMFHYEFLS